MLLAIHSCECRTGIMFMVFRALLVVQVARIVKECGCSLTKMGLRDGLNLFYSEGKAVKKRYVENHAGICRKIGGK